MAQRAVKRTPEFDRQLKKLGKRHKRLRAIVHDRLNSISTNAIPDGDQISRFRGLPVFKIRCKTGEDKGLRSGARIIYFKDTSKLVALYRFLKSDRINISDKKIIEILKNNHLYAATPTKS